MTWHVYKKDDPTTWPEIDCPMLVYDEIFGNLYVWKWNNELKKFIDNGPEKAIHYIRECYYQYIGYVPDGYKVYKARKCSVWEERRCQYADDGYCFDLPKNVKCKFAKEVNEYWLNDNKRIWKEFE